MEQPFDIAEVARRTGLTTRALRFYEARGLVRPLRTASGRRCYGAGELERLTRVVALKSAGFSLADIGRLLDGRRLDLGRLLDAQLEALDAEAVRVTEARRLILTAKSRIDRGEPLDAATLCSLIRTGDQMMENDTWKAIGDRYLTDDAKADFAAAPMPAGFDQAAYSAQWADLSARIQAALPMDPASPPAQAFVAEWKALLAPFSAVATPAMMQGVGRMYDNMAEWQGEQAPPFAPEVWAFIREAGRCGSAPA